ncbi:hypothetical protein HY732_01785 [Candidatus Uhrbacteria bacterium]|nr:hypothetical protein [Candidatus Uhrbacteria bacterium]
MTEASPTGRPSMPEALERLLSDPKTLDILVDGGAPATALIRELFDGSAQDTDTEQQRAMLTSLIDLLGREGEREITDRRAAALTILSDYVIREHLLNHSDALYQSYHAALNAQTRKNNPSDGSIAALLKGGNAMAPYLAWSAKQRTEVKDGWHRLAEQFIGDFEVRDSIRTRSAEMQDRMSPDPWLDMRVEHYREQGLIDTKKIGKREKKDPSTIARSIKRLIKQERTPNQTGKKINKTALTATKVAPATPHSIAIKEMMPAVRRNREIKKAATQNPLELRGRQPPAMQEVRRQFLARAEALQQNNSEWVGGQEKRFAGKFDNFSSQDIHREYREGLSTYAIFLYRTFERMSPEALQTFLNGTDFDFYIRAYTFDFILSLRYSAKRGRVLGVHDKHLARLAYRHAPRILTTLRNEFPHSEYPDVDERMIARAATTNPQNPKQWIRATISLIADLRRAYPIDLFPQVENWMIKYYACLNRERAAQALTDALGRIDGLRGEFPIGMYPAIDDPLIKRLAVYSPRQARDKILLMVQGAQRLHERYPEATEQDAHDILLYPDEPSI